MCIEIIIQQPYLSQAVMGQSEIDWLSIFSGCDWLGLIEAAERPPFPVKTSAAVRLSLRLKIFCSSDQPDIAKRFA